MINDNVLFLMSIFLGVGAIAFTLGGIYILVSNERRKKLSSFHMAVAMILFGAPSLLAVVLYFLYRYNFLEEWITENGCGFLVGSFVVVALLVSDVYTLIYQKEIENKKFIYVARQGLFLSIVGFISVIIFWIRTVDKSTLFLFLK